MSDLMMGHMICECDDVITLATLNQYTGAFMYAWRARAVYVDILFGNNDGFADFFVSRRIK